MTCRHSSFISSFVSTRSRLIQDQFGEAKRIQFLMKVPGMRFDGMDTNIQGLRDFLVGFAFCRQS
jgi:hypothetical protein